MEKKKIIRPVFVNKKTGQKTITLPKKSEFEEGDYVEIKKLILR